MLITPAIKYDLDLVIMNNYKIIPHVNYKWKVKSNVSYDIYNKPLYYPEIFNKYYINFFGINIFSTNSYWGKLYKRNVILNSQIEFPDNDTYEDNVFNFRLFPYIKSMMFIDYLGYYWRWGGITSGKKSDIYREFRFIDFMTQFYNERKDAIIKYNYSKAHKWLLLEMKNVLKSNFSNIAKYKPDDTKAKSLKEQIKFFLKQDAYKDMYLLHKIYPECIDDSYILAIINSDYEFIYKYCYDIYKNKRKRMFFKQILHKFIYTLFT